MRHLDEATRAIKNVEDYSKRASTGELSFTTREVSASVYLQAGRIAWATSSIGQFSFSRELSQRANVEPAVLRLLVERCRAQRIPLGEALIAANIADQGLVRELLRLQIVDVLTTLRSLSGASVVFVARIPERAYSEQLTFSLEEVSPRRPARTTAEFVGARGASADSSRSSTQRTEGGGTEMANLKDTLAKVMEIEGAVGACAVDSNSGMMLGAAGSGVNLEIAAAGNTEVVRSKRKTMKALGLNDSIDDILITLGKQYHIIRPLGSNDALFLYLILDRHRGNLAMARHQLTSLERELSL